MVLLRTGRYSARRLGWGLALLGLLLCVPLRAAEVLLTASEDSEGCAPLPRSWPACVPRTRCISYRWHSYRRQGNCPGHTPGPAGPAKPRLAPAGAPGTGDPGLAHQPPASRAALAGAPRARLSLLWSDPPLARQLRLIRSVLPQVRRVGVLYGQDSQFLLEELRLAARSLELEIIAESWDNIGDSRPLQAVLRNSEVLLGLDDPSLYNPKTVKNLLLSSYARQQA